MSSKSYLSGEARWAREQEARIQREVESLRDPRSLRRARADAVNKVRSARYKLETAVRDSRALGDDVLAETIGGLERDVDHWRNLAREYEDRICADEDQPTLGDA